LVATLAVELLGRAFAEVPDAIRMPWLPGLISNLKEFSSDVLPPLFKEAFLIQPRRANELDAWVPPWQRTYDKATAPIQETTPAVNLSEDEAAARTLLVAHRDSANALASRLGLAHDWQETLRAAPAAMEGPVLSEDEAAARARLFSHQ